jgi:hypothetical protein
VPSPNGGDLVRRSIHDGVMCFLMNQSTLTMSFGSLKVFGFFGVFFFMTTGIF